MDKRLLDILCCPATRQPLQLLAEDERAALNEAIAAERVMSEGGRRVDAAVAAGLLTRDRRTIYRVDDDIPVMLVDESIATAQLPGFPAR